jgi:hypothetical protein
MLPDRHCQTARTTKRVIVSTNCACFLQQEVSLFLVTSAYFESLSHGWPIESEFLSSPLSLLTTGRNAKKLDVLKTKPLRINDTSLEHGHKE